MLKKNNFFIDGLRITEEIEVSDLICDTLSCLASASASCWCRALLWSLDVIKVEVVRVKNDLCCIVEVDAVRAIGKHVSKTIL